MKKMDYEEIKRRVLNPLCAGTSHPLRHNGAMLQDLVEAIGPQNHLRKESWQWQQTNGK
jgi:hypothetical protein